MELVQGTPEWISWRNSGLGSSDISAILGLSPYKTAYRLWQERTGRKKPKEANAAMQRGSDGEAKIRALYELQTGLDVPPACVEHAEHPYFRVSLDGYIPGDLVVEMKFLGAERHSLAQQGKIPPDYYAQVQYQLAITGAKHAHYVSYNGESIEIVATTPDQAYIDDMLPKVQEFWRLILTDTPPTLTDQDSLEPTDAETMDAFEEWKRQKLMMMQLEEIFEQVKAKHREREAALEAAREKVQSRMIHPKITCAGVKASMVKRKNGATLTIQLEGEV